MSFFLLVASTEPIGEKHSSYRSSVQEPVQDKSQYTKRARKGEEKEPVQKRAITGKEPVYEKGEKKVLKCAENRYDPKTICS